MVTRPRYVGVGGVGLLLPLLLLAAGAALGEDDVRRKAREEVEHQLKTLVVPPPTKVRVDYVGLEDANYRLEEATFELDGRSLGSPQVSALAEDKTYPIWEGEVPPGKHVVRARLVFSSGASVVMSDEGGFRWRVAGDVSFDVLSGIEVRVKVVPRREANQKDINKRFALSLPASPVMLARLDDGSLPEAPARKRGGTALEKGLPAVEEGTQREAKGASVGDGRPAKAERTRAADQGPLRVAQRDNPPEPRPETPRPAIPSAAPGGEPAEHAPAQRPPLPGPSAERPPDPPLAVRAPEPIAPGQPNSAAAKYEEEKTDGLWWMLGGLAVGLVGLVVLLVARRGGSRR